ncbi:hypothetical protein C2G38_2194674 [Gigaspora rosea]|uniref:HCP-like protein n=1 Tax=Gigaspora rosea TaxID=44941 RepID=A0A397UYC9_9GLOM|nr:hypothetical protein C2G38_2194674 [Gigaspora rosea]
MSDTAGGIIMIVPTSIKLNAGRPRTSSFIFYQSEFCGQNNLEYCYQNGIGTDKNNIKAFECYLKSARGGNSRGQCNVGFCYKNGIGTAKNEKKHLNGNYKRRKKAFEWYLKLAEGGYPNGQYKLGLCYRNGIGTSPDQAKASE